MNRNGMFSIGEGGQQGGRFGCGEGDPQWEDGDGWSEETPEQSAGEDIVKVCRMEAEPTEIGQAPRAGAIALEPLRPRRSGIDAALQSALDDPRLLALIWLSRISSGK